MICPLRWIWATIARTSGGGPAGRVAAPVGAPGAALAAMPGGGPPAVAPAGGPPAVAPAGGPSRRFRSSCSMAIATTPCNKRTVKPSCCRLRKRMPARRAVACVSPHRLELRQAAAGSPARSTSIARGMSASRVGPCMAGDTPGRVAMQAVRIPTALARMHLRKWCGSSWHCRAAARHERGDASSSARSPTGCGLESNQRPPPCRGGGEPAPPSARVGDHPGAAGRHSSTAADAGLTPSPNELWEPSSPAPCRMPATAHGSPVEPRFAAERSGGMRGGQTQTTRRKVQQKQ